MTSLSANARISPSTGSAPVPVRSTHPGLVIENLDAAPDTAYALFTVCSLTQVTGPAAPSAGRLGA
ncbi:hypothetical protein [Streptomyces roseus]|uniref:Uncharacterized protein n=1 Tax=Streptomyces roseus TaxID=66430 RepID=A0A0J6XU06_9ACTN|nr:hypothetical protein [Streptomyces roseus]KMO97767.1 hypothetical protein ACS04_11430 [Streptomyces roseus]MYT20092.1 hypothetical protein [Streptomyces sp. SID7760]